jgi:hypothetical protein
MSEWQPIDTAPKDGRRFLAYVPIEGHRLVIAMYSRQGLLLNENCQPMPYPATEWMPLPARPVNGSGTTK